MLAWKRGDLAAALTRLRAAFAVGVLTLAGFGAFFGAPFLSVAAAAIALYLIAGSLVELGQRAYGRGASFRLGFSRLLGLPLSAFGTALAHAGMGLTLLGLAATGWGVENITTMRIGDHAPLGPYEIALQQTSERKGPNYVETFAALKVRSGGADIAEIEPARRYYPVRKQARAEAGIVTLGFGQVYAALGEFHDDGFDVRLYYKPLVTLIWLGAVVMALGGGLSLADRRLRLGVARRNAPITLTQPAE
jgi:cytochrome c-type biogenesis protein CcmF